MKPSLNELRQVVGTIQAKDGAEQPFTLRPPTNKDMVAIEHWARSLNSQLGLLMSIFALLSQEDVITVEWLEALPADTMEAIVDALELFPVFHQLRSKQG